MLLNLDFVHPEDAPQIQAASNQPLLVSDQLTVEECTNAVILPGGWQGGYGGVREAEEALPYLPKVEKHFPFPVVYVGEFLSTWGHLITDLLRHFWFVLNPHWAHLKTYTIAYTMHFPNETIPENFYALLALLGFEKSQLLRVDHISTFERILVPEGCYRVRNILEYYAYTQEYVDLVNWIGQHGRPQPHYQKVYFSRTQIAQKTRFYHRRDVNEQAIENIFRAQGFCIIYPEQLSFQTQLDILQSCQIFAATDGSIAHNLLFCQPHIRAIIVRKARRFTLHQITVNAVKSADVVYIDAGFSPFADRKAHWWAGPFFMFASKNLCRFFNTRAPLFPFFPFLWDYCAAELLRQMLDNATMLAIRKKLKLGKIVRKLTFKNPR